VVFTSFSSPLFAGIGSLASDMISVTVPFRYGSGGSAEMKSRVERVCVDLIVVEE
jgi:hypothetical protein